MVDLNFQKSHSFESFSFVFYVILTLSQFANSVLGDRVYG